MILLYVASIGYKTTCYLLHKTLSCTDEIHTKHLCRMARPFVFRYCASVLLKTKGLGVSLYRRWGGFLWW